MNDEKKIIKSTIVVGLATLLSRIFGLIRDVVIADFFGVSLSADVFFVAYRIPEILRNFFSEGTLSATFIPVFSGYLSIGKKEDAFEMARSAIKIISFFMLIIVIAGIIGSPVLIKIIA